MGLTEVRVRVGNPADSSRAADLDFLVDSGAVYTVVPADILSALGVVPHSQRDFILANGEVVHRSVGTATFEYRATRGDSLVIFGEPGDAALLGATTLEGFGFILDPFRRELKPIPILM